MKRIEVGIDRNIGMYYNEILLPPREQINCNCTFKDIKYTLYEGKYYFRMVIYHDLTNKQLIPQLKDLINTLYTGRENNVNYINVRRLIMEKEVGLSKVPTLSYT